MAQREPLIIPFSVAVMMSVGVWYKAGFRASDSGEADVRFEDAGVEIRGKGLIGGGAGLSDVVADVVGLVARAGYHVNKRA